MLRKLFWHVLLPAYVVIVVVGIRRLPLLWPFRPPHPIESLRNAVLSYRPAWRCDSLNTAGDQWCYFVDERGPRETIAANPPGYVWFHPRRICRWDRKPTGGPHNWTGTVFARPLLPGDNPVPTEGWYDHALVKGGFVFFGDRKMMEQLADMP